MLHTDPFRLNTKIHLTCVTCSLHLGLKEVQEYVKTFDPDELARCPITFDVSKLSVSVKCSVENNSATPKWASQGSQYTLPDCPKLPDAPVPAFIWTWEAGSYPYIFRKSLISFCLRPPAQKVCQLVLCGFPTFASPLSRQYHTYSLRVKWPPFVCIGQASGENVGSGLCLSVTHTHMHTLRHTKALLFRPS